MSWGPICWVLISEIFPNKIRSQAVAIAVAAQWAANFFISSTYPPMMEFSNGGTYLVLWDNECSFCPICMEVCTGDKRENFRGNGRTLERIIIYNMN